MSVLNVFIPIGPGKRQSIKEDIHGQRSIYLTVSSMETGFQVHRAFVALGSLPDLNLQHNE